MDRQNLPATTQTDIVVYQGDAGLKMTVKTDGETVWLTQEQMSNLFGRDQSVIVRHIGNIFKEKELVKDSVYAKFAYTASDHKVYQVAFYNLPDLRGDIMQYFLAQLSTFESKTPAFAGVLLAGLHYTVVFVASATSPEIFGGGCAGNVSPS